MSWKLGRIAFVANIAAVMLACAGTKQESARTGDAGSSGSSGVSEYDGGVSPGTATIEFTVAGADSYCATVDDCGDGTPSISIDGLNSAYPGCSSIECETCSARPCLQIACLNDMGVQITGGQLTWDGSYFKSSTCGASAACTSAAFAKPGHYTATMCATPGTLTEIDGGSPQCEPAGVPKCGHVGFDFPSDVVAKGTIEP